MTDSDPLTIACNDLPAFRKELSARGIQTAILAWRAEWAPAGETPGANHGDVVFGSLREVTVLGYHKPSGTVVKLELRGEAADRDGIKAHLQAAGLRVEERSRNIS